MASILSYVKLPCILGEGPYYHEESGILYVVDLIGHCIFKTSTNFSPPLHETIKLKIYSSVIAEINGRPNEWLIGTKSGIAVVDSNFCITETMNVWDDDQMASRMRMNDGAVDCNGRMWIGSMTDFHVGETFGEGILWRIDADLSKHVMLRDITVPNGIGWSPDNRTMYFTDSIADTIYAFDFDAETGNISKQRSFYKHNGGAHPDGLAIDENGDLWVALWNGSAVLHIDSRGQLVGEFKLPVRNVTCPCFGGREGKDLFVTTAKSNPGGGMIGEDRDDDEGGGAVFRLEVNVKGSKKNKFRINST